MKTTIWGLARMTACGVQMNLDEDLAYDVLGVDGGVLGFLNDWYYGVRGALVRIS